MCKGIITVLLQPNVLDVQGQTVRNSLHHLGFETVEQVRVGRHIEVLLPNSSPEEARQQLQQMAEQLLANPVIEDFQIEVQEV